MRTTLQLLSTVVLLATFAACARENHALVPSISQEEKTELNKVVNCGTARQDIKILEDEKASVAKQIFSGIRSIFPISAVIGILNGNYVDGVSVAIGQYNDDIEAKIKKIKQECGIWE